ncbi:hypothetical protein ACFX13_032381 [Malus domestica]
MNASLKNFRHPIHKVPTFTDTRLPFAPKQQHPKRQHHRPLLGRPRQTLRQERRRNQASKDPNVPNFGVQIVGSCNGFLCVYDRLNSCRFYISNPVIGESITLPRFPKDIGFPFLYGFGFCPVDGDYKLVVVSSTSNGLKSNEWEVMVLTVGTGSWRNVGNSVYPFGNQWYGVYHDGFLHWIARGDNSVLMPLMLKVSVSKSCHYRLVLWESVLLTLQS